MANAIHPARIDHVIYVAYGLEEFTIVELANKSDELVTVVRKLVDKKFAAGELIRMNKGSRYNPSKYRWASDDR